MIDILDGFNVFDVHVVGIGDDGEKGSMSKMTAAHTIETSVAFAGDRDFHDSSFRSSKFTANSIKELAVGARGSYSF